MLAVKALRTGTYRARFEPSSALCLPCSNTWDLQELRLGGQAYWLDARTRRVYQDMSGGEGWPELVGMYDEAHGTIRELQKSAAGALAATPFNG